MSLMTEADTRIAAKERELAQLQAEVTTPLQLELQFRKEVLQTTLQNASVFAGTVVQLLDELGHSLEEGLINQGRMQEKG